MATNCSKKKQKQIQGSGDKHRQDRQKRLETVTHWTTSAVHISYYANQWQSYICAIHREQKVIRAHTRVWRLHHVEKGAPVRRRIRCTESSVAVTLDEDWRAGCVGVADDRGMEWWRRLDDERYMTEVSSFHQDLAQCVVVQAQPTPERQTSR